MDESIRHRHAGAPQRQAARAALCGKRMRRRLARWAIACAAALAGVAAAQPATPQASGSIALERRVKAAFIYKFLGYTDFPAQAFSEPDGPVIIGIVGADDVAAEVARIVAGRIVNHHRVLVRQFRENDAPGQVHLLFVAGSDGARVGRVLRAWPARPMLLVTECDDGLQHGSVINFRIVDQHVRFDVSLDAAERNNIKLSSRLLTVANRVQKGTP
jgi:hypothetical protein